MYYCNYSERRRYQPCGASNPSKRRSSAATRRRPNSHTSRNTPNTSSISRTSLIVPITSTLLLALILPGSTVTCSNTRGGHAAEAAAMALMSPECPPPVNDASNKVGNYGGVSTKVLLPDCEGYVTCTNGVASTKVTCPQGTKYVESVDFCELEELVRVGHSSEIIEGGEACILASEEESDKSNNNNNNNNSNNNDNDNNSNNEEKEMATPSAASSAAMEARQLQQVIDDQFQMHLSKLNNNQSSNSNNSNEHDGRSNKDDNNNIRNNHHQRQPRHLATTNNANPFLPDYASTSCRNDKPAESWMSNPAKTAVQCCAASFGWAKDECEKNSNEWLLGTTGGDDDTADDVQSDTIGEEEEDTGPKKYYADQGVGICKEDGPLRPSWNNKVVEGYANCCTTLIPWSTDCLAADPDNPITNPPTQIVPTMEPTTSAPTEETKYYYPDSSVGLCKLDGPARPSWITTIVTDYQQCCTNHFYWNLAKCLEEEPRPPTVAPTTFAPTEEFNFWSDFGDGGGAGGTDLPTFSPTLSPVQDGDSDAPKPTRGPTDKPTSGPTAKPSKTTKPTKSPTPQPTDHNVVIDIATYGSLTLNNIQVPENTSKEFRKLKVALTKTIIVVLMDSGLVHPAGLEVSLWSIGGVSFNWRRDLQEGEGKQHVQDGREVTRDLSMAPKTLQFELSLPTKCNLACQDNLQGHLGQDEYDAIDAHFQKALRSGFFSKTLVSQGQELDLFMNEEDQPTASSGILTYRYAIKAVGLTWMPSPSPTKSPEIAPTSVPSGVPTIAPTVSERPTGSTYYPDYDNNICRVYGDGLHSEFEVNFFKSLEDCCAFPWIDTDICLAFSNTFKPTSRPTRRPRTRRPTREPTSSPTREPTNKPSRTKRPTGEPTTVPTRSPTKSPTTSPIESMTSDLKLFYPDIAAGVCKSDGRHAEFKATTYLSAEACCEFLSAIYDYDNCMGVALSNQNPCLGTFWPDFDAGFCRSDGQEKGGYSFDSAEVCCDNGWMDYDECLQLSYCPGYDETYFPTWSPTIQETKPPTRKPSRIPTRHPTDSPVASNTVLYYPDLYTGLCKSDGNHADVNAQTYTTADECCQFLSVKFDYDTCMGNGSGNLCGTGSFYPDFDAGYCRSDGLQKMGYTFSSAEVCCDNAWMDYGKCIFFSKCPGVPSSDANPTPLPSRLPTPMPSRPPTPVPSREPTKKPNSSSATSCGGPFYPDFGAKICRADGKQSSSAYTFDAVEDCCDNAWMNYNDCLERSDSCGDDPDESGNLISPPTPLPTSVPTRTVTPLPTSAPTPAPTHAPTTRPPTIKPTWEPTKSFTIPPVVNSAIDASRMSSVVVDGFEDGLNGGLPWHTSADFPWSTSTVEKKVGAYSARSAPITKGKSSDLHIAISSPLGGALYYYLKSEVQMPHSGCYINVDGFSKTGYTYKTNGWLDLSLEIEPGDHVIMFRTWSPDVDLPGSSAVSNTIFLDEVAFMPKLVEDFEGNKLSWKTFKQEGSGQWTFDRNYGKTGSSSFRSPSNLKVGETSKMVFTTIVPRRGSVMTFWYKASVSKTFDLFNFYINGDLVITEETVITAWASFGIALKPGENTIEWEYKKVSSDPNHPGEGAAWIDDISIVPRT